MSIMFFKDPALPQQLLYSGRDNIIIPRGADNIYQWVTR